MMALSNFFNEDINVAELFSPKLNCYRVTLFCLDLTKNYMDVKYSKFINILEDIDINNIPNTNIVSQFYENPPDIDKILFLFVGSIDSNIKIIIDKITENPSKGLDNLENSEISILNEYFNYDVNENWKIETLKYKKIYFIPVHIDPYFTISNLYKLISYHINDQHKLSTSSNSITIYSNNCNNVQEEYRNYISHIIKRYYHEDFKFTIVILRNYLKTIIPINVQIDLLLEKYKNDLKNINLILNDPIVHFYYKLKCMYKPLNHHFKSEYGDKLSSTYVPKYFHYEMDTNYFSLIENDDHSLNNNNKILSSITSSRELFVYSLHNIHDAINNYDSKMLENIYNHGLIKLFPKIQFQKIDDIIPINKNELQHMFNSSLNIRETFSSFGNLSNDIEVKVNKMYVLNFSHEIYLPDHMDLRYLFNNIPLSFDVPIVKYKDRRTKDIVYKIYDKLSKNNKKYLSILNNKELYKWLKYKNYELKNFTVKQSQKPPKELYYKILIEHQEDINLSEGLIIHIYSSGLKTYADINSDNVTNYKIDITDKPNSKIGDKIQFYKKKAMYADIEISSKNISKINVSFNLSDYIYSTKLENVDQQYQFYIDKIRLIKNSIDEFAYNNLFSSKLLAKYQNIYPYIQTFHDAKFLYSKYNLSYSLKIKNNQRINVSNIKETLRKLYPFLYLIEDIIYPSSKLDMRYLDTSDSKWYPAIIKSQTTSKFENLYSISYEKLGKTINLDNVSPMYLRHSESENTNKISFVLKNVNNFKYTEVIRNYILKLLSHNLSKQDVIFGIDNYHGLIKHFSLTYTEAEKHFDKVFTSHNDKISTYTYDDLNLDIDDNIPVISIDYNTFEAGVDKSTYIYTVFIENISSLHLIKYIHKLIYFITDFHNYQNLSESDKKFHVNNLIMSSINYIEATEVTESVQRTSSQEVDTFTNDDLDDDDDDDSIDQLSDLDDDIEEIDWENEDNLDDTDEVINNPETKEIESEITNISMSSGKFNALIDKLYEKAPEIFKQIDKNEVRYTRKCQKRTPVLLTQEEKNRIDEKDKVLYKKTHNNSNLRSYFNLETDLEIDVPSDFNTNTSDRRHYSSIKYGIDSQNLNWYICPKIFDLKTNQSLDWTELTYDKIDGKTFEPVDFFSTEKWRIDKHTGKDIVEYNPKSSEGHTVITQGTAIQGNNSILLRGKGPQGLIYPYPGFLGTGDEGLIPMPCCYQTQGSNRTIGLSLKNKSQVHNPNLASYIKDWGEILKPKRRGLLSKEMYSVIDPENECITGELRSDRSCFLRFGIDQNHDSFLNMMNLIIFDSDDIYKFKDYIVNNLSYNQFKTINNGQLEVEFRNYGKQSSYQNFLEYVLSDQPKNYKHFYQILTERSNPKYSKFQKSLPDQAKGGMFLIIFEIESEKELLKENPKIEILTPSFSYNVINDYKAYNKVNERGIYMNIALAIKVGNKFEPIFKVLGNDVYNPMEQAENEQTIYKLFERKDPDLKKLCDQYISKSIESNISQNLSMLSRITKKRIFDQKFNFGDIYKLLVLLKRRFQKEPDKYRGYQPKIMLTDSYNRIYGILLENMSIIPIYPIAMSIHETLEVNDSLGLSLKTDISNPSSLISPYKLTTLKTHLDTYKFINSICNENSIPIYISPIYYFKNDNEEIDAFITNVGTIVNFIPVFDNTQKIKLTNNFTNVDKEIKLYQKMIFNSVYTENLTFDEINTYQSIKIKSYKIVIDYKKGRNVSGIIMLKTDQDIIIPISYTDADLPKISKLENDNRNTEYQVTNIDTYLENIKFLYTNHGNLPFYPVSFKLKHTDQEKRYTHMILASGFLLELSIDQKFNILTKQEDEYLINNYLDRIETFTDLNIPDTESLVTTSRKKIVKKMNYHDNIMKAIQLKFFNLLQNDYCLILKDFLHTILESNYNHFDKKFIIYPLIKLLIDYLTINVSDEPEIYPDVQLDNICSLENCLGNLCFKTIQSQSDEQNYKVSNIEKYLEITSVFYNLSDTKLKKYFSINRLGKFTSNAQDNKIKFIKNLDRLGDFTKSFNLYNQLIELLPDTICKLKVINIDKKIQTIQYSIIDNLIKNNYFKFYMINSYGITEDNEKFVEKKNEIMIFNEELEDEADLQKFFEKSSKKYNRNIINFDEIEFKVNLENVNSESVDRCFIKGPYKHSFKYTQKDKKLNIISDITNKIDLNDNEYSKLRKMIILNNTTYSKQKINTRVFKYKINELHNLKNLMGYSI